MIIQKISQNLKSSQLLSFHDNIPFIFECFITYNTSSSMKKHCESTEPESHQMAKMFFYLSSSYSSDGLFYAIIPFFKHSPHTDCISNSAILQNDYISLLSD